MVTQNENDGHRYVGILACRMQSSENRQRLAHNIFRHNRVVFRDVEGNQIARQIMRHNKACTGLASGYDVHFEAKAFGV